MFLPRIRVSGGGFGSLVNIEGPMETQQRSTTCCPAAGGVRIQAMRTDSEMGCGGVIAKSVPKWRSCAFFAHELHK